MESEWDETLLYQTREERELQFSPSKWFTRISPAAALVENHIGILTKGSEEARQTLDCELDMAYGNKPLEKIDIFGGQTLPADAPVFCYIHGGDWAMLGRESSSFMAPYLVESGIVVIPIGYQKAPEVDMPEIVTEIKKAVSFILKWAKNRGTRSVYIGGHCAGGHLAAMMLGIDWTKECDISNDLLKGGILISGIFDVRPLVDTYIGDPLNLTREVAWECSPCKHVDTIASLSRNRTLIIVMGGKDTPTFRQQSSQFAEAMRKRKVSVIVKDFEEYDHFQISEKSWFEYKEITNVMMA
ncbi:kynurenine formamidase-like [Mizuhopecten yessoensis]|uniref:Kynurenine formamidase n=1 Tax=Mizuhopecten yessoensis TaxID=6573 RepID=A0A210Q8U8_MIZYE|nr:kynurenine formamidase-like [Mizuhopecten yessoensis]OWF45109.1 Kynurenine formamidase [Mizuhopecten yessoensis]